MHVYNILHVSYPLLPEMPEMKVVFTVKKKVQIFLHWVTISYSFLYHPALVIIERTNQVMYVVYYRYYY